MFGYIQPDAPYLFKKDEKLYQALYCGLCKSIGKGCGQCARTALTYDMAFMSALVHNIKKEDVIIKKVRCAIHWLKRRPVALVDDTTVLIGCVNTALAYYKLCDDKADGDRKGIFRHLYKKGLKRAAKKHKAAVEMVREFTAKQSELEKAGCAVIDMACEPTAELMKKLSAYALGEYSTQVGISCRRARRLRQGRQKGQIQRLIQRVQNPLQGGRGAGKRAGAELPFRQSVCRYEDKFVQDKIPLQSRFDRQYYIARNTVENSPTDSVRL